jgi:hypothetical protein
MPGLKCRRGVRLAPARLPRIDTLAKLAAALSASPNELLDGIVWSPGSMRAGRFEDGGASGMQK